jgi:hypothetical protein
MTAITARMRFPELTRAGYSLALALSLALAYALVVTGYVATGRLFERGDAAATSPGWSKPLLHVRPYSVQPGYGTSRGMTCDLTVYTTNKAALDGKARLHPGDTTATVCVVRKADGPGDKPAPAVSEAR